MIEKYKELIKESLKKIELPIDCIIGILLYGSTITGYNDELSDIDILFVIDDASKQEGRGVVKVLNNRVEYFIVSETKVYTELLRELNTVSPALIMAFTTGIIYFEKYGVMQKLRKRSQQILEMPYLKMSSKEVKIDVNILRNHLKELERKYIKKSDDYNFCYYNYVDELIAFYARYKCIAIKDYKTYELLVSKEYRERFLVKNYFSEDEEKMLLEMIKGIIEFEKLKKNSNYIFRQVGCESVEFIIKE